MGVVQDIGHILLPVDDMEKALAFYRDLLGFRVVGKGSPVWTVIETKGGQLTLWRTSEIPKVALGPKADSSPFEFHVENFEDAASALESRESAFDATERTRERFGTRSGTSCEYTTTANEVHRSTSK